MTNVLPFSEGFAIASGMLQALLVFLLWMHHRNRRQWGLNWMAGAMFCGAVINVAAPILITGELLGSPRDTVPGAAGFLALFFGTAAFSALLVGLRFYCLAAPQRPWALFAAVWLGSQVLILAGYGPGLRQVGDLCVAAVFIYGALLCWRTSRVEPDVGHRLVAAALLAQPACFGLLLLMDFDPRAARYASAVPFTMIGLVLLSASLVRLRSELLAELALRQEAEESLRGSQQLLASTFDLLPEPLAQIDGESGRYIDVNRMWVQRMGIAREAALGRTSLELGLWAQASERDALRERLDREGHIENVPVSYRIPQGGEIACEVSATNLQLGDRRVGLWLTRDVTQRMRNEEALKASEQRFRTLFELSPVPMVLADAKGACVMVNRHWMQLVGYGPEAMPSPQAWWELACPDPAYRAAAREEWESRPLRSRESGADAPPMERDILCADGRTRTLLFDGADVGDGCVVSAHDLTERKRLENELRQLAEGLEERVRLRTQELVRSEKLASLGALVAGVAHELNTPIGNATMVASTLAGRLRAFEAGMADGLRRTALHQFLQDVREIEAVLDRNLQRAAGLITSFKQLAVDQTSEQRRRFSLADVVGEVLLALSPVLKRGQIEVAVDVEPALMLDSYPGPLGQVLMNLINNAVVHAFEPNSAGQILIKAWSGARGNVLVEVADNGRGIPAEHGPRLFDPFFTTRMGQGGSGLGLHIVHNLVTGPLGGTIDVSSTPREGACFRLDLPLGAPTHKTTPAAAPLPAAQSTS
jgi:PAS domain S-box-containing protein